MVSSTTQQVVATAPGSAEGYAVNVATLLGENLGSRLFRNVHELAHYVKQFERISGSYYSVRNSKANSSGDKTFIKYQCDRKDLHIFLTTENDTDCSLTNSARRTSKSAGMLHGATYEIHDINMVEAMHRCFKMELFSRGIGLWDAKRVSRMSATYLIWNREEANIRHFGMFVSWLGSMVQHTGPQEIQTTDTSIADYDQLPQTTLLNLDAPALQQTNSPKDLSHRGHTILLTLQARMRKELFKPFTLVSDGPWQCMTQGIILGPKSTLSTMKKADDDEHRRPLPWKFAIITCNDSSTNAMSMD
ncbi:hypothetical protein CLF_111157 [Clonorchis sinensis]|uniref:Uncharacterized protein n=1 Tax=Clonorchis sinensis TaxID=79923 RepID=G7YUG0_CLOSI|nr:hypothetical protein CLF_111157 [Clonorchis sinensis]